MFNKKKNCLIERRKVLNKKDAEYKYIDTPTEKLFFNQIIYPYYLNSIKNSEITNFIKTADLDNENILNEIWNIIIKYIETNIDPIYEQWKKKQIKK